MDRSRRYAAQCRSRSNHHGFAVSAVEFNSDPFTRVLRGNVEDTPVPPDASTRILAPQRVKPFVQQIRIVLEGQLHGPVVRQVEAFPLAVVVSDGAGWHEIPGLLKIADRRTAKSEVLVRIIRVPKVKAPPEVEQQPLAPRVRAR